MQSEQFVNQIERYFRTTRAGNEQIVRSLTSRGAVSVGPQTINYMLNRNIQLFQNGAVNTVGAAVVVAMQEAIAAALPAVSGAAQGVFTKFALSSKEQVNRQVGLARLHETLANEAHQITIQRYESTVGSNGHARYRAGQGRLTGQMRKALDDPNVIRAQRDGIIYGNTAVLDRTAAHWRRLNFGAGERGRQRFPQPVPLRLNGQRTGGYLRFGSGPSPDFVIPRGVWFSGEGAPVPWGDRGRGHQFFPLSQLQGLNEDRMQGLGNAGLLRGGGRVTAGIRGYHFMEAGLFHIGSNYLGRLQTLGVKWMEWNDVI